MNFKLISLSQMYIEIRKSVADRYGKGVRYQSRGTTFRKDRLAVVGPLHGCGMVRPIRSDRYCTPPYNLYRLMTSITLLRVLPASTTRVVYSLGHGSDTRLCKIFSFSRLIFTTDHTEHTQQGRIGL